MTNNVDPNDPDILSDDPPQSPKVPGWLWFLLCVAVGLAIALSGR